VALSKGELVVVTSNYRNNVFGFLAADDLRARDPVGGTGNCKLPARGHPCYPV
jgi:carboxylesterase type B